MSNSEKLILVSVVLSLTAILSGLLFGQEITPNIAENMDVWVSHPDEDLLYQLSDTEKPLFRDILSKQKKMGDASRYQDFVLSFAAYKDGRAQLKLSLYRLTDGTNEFVMKYEDGRCYSLDTRAVLLLLTSPTLDDIFDYIEDAPAMTVTEGQQSLTLYCVENGWQYKKIDNSIFMDGILKKNESTQLVPEDYTALQLSFSTEPQVVTVEISLKSTGEVIHKGSGAGLKAFDPPVSGVYRMRVSAQWTEEDGRRYSGLCVYELDLVIKKEAEVLVSSNSVPLGGLITVTVTNPENPETLRVITKMGADSGFIRKEEGIYVCLVAAKNAGEFLVQVSGDGVSGEHYVTVTRPLPQQNTLEEPFPLLPGADDMGIFSFEEHWAAFSSQKSTSKYWKGPFRSPMEGKPDVAFGQTFKDQPAQMYGTSFWRIEDAGEIAAVNDGIVRFVGVLDHGGLTVVIDHGLGIFSWYYGLSEAYVEEGDAILSGGAVGLIRAETEPVWAGFQMMLGDSPVDIEKIQNQTWPQ